MPRRVVFLTTVFDEVANGPAIYARYLWEAFRDDPEIKFHVVAPAISQRHSQLHAAGTARSSLATYRKTAACALELAAALGPNTILHSNGAHLLPGVNRFNGVLLVQSNDYDGVDVWTQPVILARRYGLRRLASLVWRHHREARTVRTATRVICNSNYTCNRVRAGYGCDPARTVTIYKGVVLSEFARPVSPPPDPFPQVRTGARLITVGSDWRKKGVRELIESLAAVRRIVPEAALIVAGPRRERDLTQLAELIRRHHVSEHVHCVGLIPRDELATALWHADLFVLPSHEEALGVAILEAMAAGLPVIATRVGGIPEIIRTPDEGVLVEPGDADALGEAIVALLTDRNRRERLIREGTARARAFSIEKTVTQVRDLYLSLT